MTQTLTALRRTLAYAAAVTSMPGADRQAIAARAEEITADIAAFVARDPACSATPTAETIGGLLEFFGLTAALAPSSRPLPKIGEKIWLNGAMGRVGTRHKLEDVEAAYRRREVNFRIGEYQLRVERSSAETRR